MCDSAPGPQPTGKTGDRAEAHILGLHNHTHIPPLRIHSKIIGGLYSSIASMLEHWSAGRVVFRDGLRTSDDKASEDKVLFARVLRGFRMRKIKFRFRSDLRYE